MTRVRWPVVGGGEGDGEVSKSRRTATFDHVGAGGRITPLENAMRYALRGVRVVPLHFPIGPPSLIDGGGDSGRLVCSCLELDCQAPGLHPLEPLEIDNATCDPVQLARWFAQVPRANVAAVVVAGRGCLDLIVFSEAGPPAEVEQLDLWRSGGSLFRPGMGELVVLPPSRFIDGSYASWLVPWEQAGMPPDRDQVLATVAGIPAPDRLAAWDVTRQDGQGVRACGK